MPVPSNILPGRRHIYWWCLLKILVFLAAACLPATGTLTGAYAGQSRGRVMISAREKAAVDSDRIYLGDVARINGGDRKLRRRLSGLYLCPAPPLGESKAIDAGLVIRRLKQKGICPAGCGIDFKRPVKATRRYQSADPKLIRAAVMTFVRRRLAGTGARVKIGSIQIPKTVRLPRGRVTLAVQRPGRVQLRGRTPLQVRIAVNGRLVRQIRVVADVRLFAMAVVSTRPLGRRQPITGELVALRQVEVTRCGRNYYTALEQVLGMRTRSALAVDTILAPSLLEVIPVVHRGDVVRMVAESGGLRIITRGICREEGAPGQRIRVTNAKSRKEVFAEVVDSDTVKVSF